MVFNPKVIQVDVAYASKVFAGGNTQTLTGVQSPPGSTSQSTYQGLRISAHIDIHGGDSGSQMDLAIYGLPLEMMNRLSTLGTQIYLMAQNGISVSAGELGGQMIQVFQGNIVDAFMDGEAMPQVPFRIHAVIGTAIYAVKPAPPVSKQGQQDVASLISGLTQQMGWQFENNGVNTKLMNPYYPGNIWTQIHRLAKHANINLWADPSTNTIAIAPLGQGRSQTVSLAPPKLVKYPQFSQAHLIARSYFDDYKVGSKVNVKSSVTPACGTWQISDIIHEIEAFMPHGKWFSTLICNPVTGVTPP